MRRLAGKELTHRTLDELPAGKTVEHLRAVLVAIGTLPERDEHMSRLERWTAWVIAECLDPGQQQLHRYAVWHVTRRLRARLGGSHATHNQVVAAQRHIKAAVAYIRCRIPALPSAQHAATASMAALPAAARISTRSATSTRRPLAHRFGGYAEGRVEQSYGPVTVPDLLLQFLRSSHTKPATAPRIITAPTAINQAMMPKIAPTVPYVLLSEMIVSEK